MVVFGGLRYNIGSYQSEGRLFSTRTRRSITRSLDKDLRILTEILNLRVQLQYIYFDSNTF